MKYSIVTLLAGVASVATAHPASEVAAAADPRFTQWMAPGAGDVRGPCPGLNTLANHGFINRNGKNNTLATLIPGLLAGMNVGVDFTTAIGLVGVGSSSQPELGAFNLDDLDKHDQFIEHDASLSRQDAYFGNDYSFNQSKWDMVLSYYAGMTKTSIPVASKAKYARVQDSNKTNPTFTYGPREFILSYGETALYLQTMSDPFSGIAKLKYVKSLFEQEKLPYDLGWRPSKTEITLMTLGDMIFELNAANPQANTEDVMVTKDSYADVLEILQGLANETASAS